MKIFLDFDDVIFNSKRFSADLRKVFVSSGISEADFWRDYLDYPVKGKTGIRKYNAWHHLELLRRRGADTADVAKKLDRFMRQVQQYLFPDIRKFFRAAGKKDIFVVSYGDSEFQKSKIMQSLGQAYAGRVVISDQTKSRVLRHIIRKQRILKAEPLVSIDDRIENIHDIKKNLPEVTTILAKRREGRYNYPRDKYCDFEIKTLWQAMRIIRRLRAAAKK